MGVEGRWAVRQNIMRALWAVCNTAGPFQICFLRACQSLLFGEGTGETSVVGAFLEEMEVEGEE